jgi:hypothetical protein
MVRGVEQDATLIREELPQRALAHSAVAHRASRDLQRVVQAMALVGGLRTAETVTSRTRSTDNSMPVRFTQNTVFERYDIVSVGDLREAARRLDIATGTFFRDNRRTSSKV